MASLQANDSYFAKLGKIGDRRTSRNHVAGSLSIMGRKGLQFHLVWPKAPKSSFGRSARGSALFN